MLEPGKEIERRERTGVVAAVADARRVQHVADTGQLDQPRDTAGEAIEHQACADGVQAVVRVARVPAARAVEKRHIAEVDSQQVLAKRFDPYKINVAQLAQDRAVTVDAETDVDDVVATMIEHKIRWLPVLDDRQLVGVIAAGDIARTVPHERAGHLLEALSLS